MRHVNPARFDRRALFVGTLACFAKACAQRAASDRVPASAHPRLHQPVPAFEKRDLQGRLVTSGSFAGRRWVLDFFAAYCATCHQRFEALREALPPANVVAVSVDEDADVALAQVRRFALAFSVIHDPARMMAGKFRVTTLPITFVMDSQNCVRWVADAQVTGEHFARGLRQTMTAVGVERA